MSNMAKNLTVRIHMDTTTLLHNNCQCPLENYIVIGTFFGYCWNQFNENYPEYRLSVTLNIAMYEKYSSKTYKYYRPKSIRNRNYLYLHH